MTPILIGSPVAGPAAAVVAVDAAVVVLPAAVVVVAAGAVVAVDGAAVVAVDAAVVVVEVPPHATTNATVISNTAINPAIVSLRIMYSLPFSYVAALFSCDESHKPRAHRSPR
jgi:hypothetical protein